MSEYSSELTDPHSLRNRWARWMSDALNPLFAPVYFLLILIWETPALAWNKILGSTVALFFFIALPLWILHRFQRAGRISSLDLEIRHQRIRPYFFALISYAVGWIAMAFIPLEHTIPVLTIIGCYLFNSSLGLVITLRWKISIHTASLTTVIGFAWMMYAYEIIANQQALFLVAMTATILLPLLMLARRKLRVHSWAEIGSGAIIAFILTVIETYVLLI
jgi:hypothetical protein